MILLDTNAVIWTLLDHPRAKPIGSEAGRLYVSPVSLLEMKLLEEVGKLTPRDDRGVRAVLDDGRWVLDALGSDALVSAALDLSWTRDPFDRLLVAHAQARRWRFATGDRRILEHLPPRDVVAL